MTIHNLPNLRPNHNVPKIDTSGRWTSINVDLEAVAGALPVDSDRAFVDADEPIRAIPDPWAQATAFGHALLKAARSAKKGGKSDGLSKRALSQWRGLLAIMALHHHSKDFTLQPQRVDLKDDSAFANVLTTLTPAVAIEGGPKLWGEPTLVMLQRSDDPSGLFAAPLAMTNPICLISPGRSSHTLVVPNVHWAQGDLCDPLAPGAAKLSGRDLSILYHFVSNLAKEAGNRTGVVGEDIASLLVNYVKDIQTALNRTVDKVVDPINQQSGEARLFRPLWNEYKIDETIPPSDRISDAVVKVAAVVPAATSEAKAGAFRGFIIVDAMLAEAYGKDPSEILIWGRDDLATLLRSDAKLEETRAKAAREGYILLTIDDLLTSRAVRLKKRPLIESHPDGFQEMILPVRPLALLMVSDISKALSGGTTGDRAMMTLTIRLDDGSPEGRKLNLTRRYALKPGKDNECLLVEDENWEIYNCQIWPNFRSTAWKTYLARFLYNADLAGKITRPTQALSAALLREEIAAASDCANAARALKDINAGQPTTVRKGEAEAPLFKAHDRLTGKKNSFREEIQFSNQAFDAIYYVDALGDERSEAPVGLVLLNAQVVQPPTAHTKVAIDFGTTNTVAAHGSIGAPAVTFANRLMLPIRRADAMVHESQMHGYALQFTDFLPPEERGTPIPTVANPKLPYNAQETLWAFRNIIFFYTAQPPAQGREEVELNDFLESTKHALFDLKWSQLSQERDAAKDFLTQFMVMTAAELLALNIDPAKSTWYFSVPEAFSNSARADFHDAVIRSSSAIGQSQETDFPPLLSEGLAAGHYMLESGQFTSDKLNIILDIGGGTTDITIWNGKVPIWRGSLKLAGRNFFTSLLVQNTDILEKIGLGGWARSLNAFDKQRDPRDAEKRRKQMAEMLFSGRSTDGEESDLKKALDNFWGRVGGSDGDVLRHAALAYLAGVAWYVGKVVRQLMRDGLLGSYDEEQGTGAAVALVSNTAFAVCGRGGGIFQMMHGRRRPADETNVTKALAVFGHSIGIADCGRPRFSASNAPKLEVVRGMLNVRGDSDAQKLRADAIANLSKFMPAGLGVAYGEGKLAVDGEIDSVNLPAEVQSINMDAFEDFLKAFEACTGIVIDIRSEERESAHEWIASTTASQLREMREKLDKTPRNQLSSVLIEQPFVIALRALVDIMAKSAVDRGELLQVWGAE